MAGRGVARTKHGNDGGGGRGSDVCCDCVRAHGRAKLAVELQVGAFRSTTMCSDASCGAWLRR